MKKVSKSINPEQHVQTNNLDIAASQQLQRTDLTEKQKVIVESVHQILQKYRENQEKDLTQRNIYLIQFITEHFQEILKPYIDDFSKTVELDKIIKEALEGQTNTDDQSEDVSEQISDIVRKSIKKIQSDTKKEQLQKQLDVKTLENIFDDLKNKGNIKSIREKIQKDNKSFLEKHLKEYKNKLISQFRSEKNSNVKTKTITKKSGELFRRKEEKEHTSEQRQKQRNPFGGIRNVNRLITLNLKNTFSKFNSNVGKIFGGTFQTIKNVKAKIGASLSKAFGMISAPIKGIIKGIAKTATKTLSFMKKGMMKTAKFFKIDKMIGTITGCFKDIGKLVKNIIKNSFLAFLKTPVGMYSMGFLIGYVWTKVMSKFKDDDPKNKMMTKIENAFDTIWTEFSRMYWYMHETIIAPIMSFLKPIIEDGRDLVFWMLNFGREHPIITGLLSSIIPLVQFFSKFSLTLKAFKSSPSLISGLVASAIVLAFTGIKNVFQTMKEEKNKGYAFNMLKQGLSEKFDKYDTDNAANSMFVRSLSDADSKKYESILKNYSNEKALLDNALANLDTIQNILKEDSDGLNRSDYDLFLEMPELIDDIFDSPLFGKDTKAKQLARVQMRGKTIKEQLGILKLYITGRYNKLISLRAALNGVESTKELEAQIHNLGEVDSVTGKLTLSKNTTDALATLDTNLRDHNEEFTFNKTAGSGWYGSRNPNDYRGTASVWVSESSMVNDVRAALAVGLKSTKQTKQATHTETRPDPLTRGYTSIKTEVEHPEFTHTFASSIEGNKFIDSVYADGNFSDEEQALNKEIHSAAGENLDKINYIQNSVDVKQLRVLTTKQRQELFANLLKEYQKKYDEWRDAREKQKKEEHDAELGEVLKDTEEAKERIKTIKKRVDDYEKRVGKNIKMGPEGQELDISETFLTEGDD